MRCLPAAVLAIFLAAGKHLIGMIMMTGVAHRDPEQGDYEAWLSDVAARNTELFYPEPLREWREYLPLYRFGPGAPRKPRKIWYEDALIVTANRYFLTLAQLRSQICPQRPNSMKQSGSSPT